MTQRSKGRPRSDNATIQMAVSKSGFLHKILRYEHLFLLILWTGLPGVPPGERMHLNSAMIQIKTEGLFTMSMPAECFS